MVRVALVVAALAGITQANGPCGGARSYSAPSSTGGESWNGQGWTPVHVETNAEQYPGPVYPPKQVVPEKPLFFLGTSAYRDVRCGRTVFEAFEKASDPERIRVGVVDQLGDGDIPCMEAYCTLSRAKHNGKCMYQEHITVTTKNYLDSRGPNPARYYQQKLIQDEDFCLQVDAHCQLQLPLDC
jgi:hypothetical protein